MHAQPSPGRRFLRGKASSYRAGFSHYLKVVRLKEYRSVIAWLALAASSHSPGACSTRGKMMEAWLQTSGRYEICRHVVCSQQHVTKMAKLTASLATASVYGAVPACLCLLLLASGGERGLETRQKWLDLPFRPPFPVLQREQSRVWLSFAGWPATRETR